MLAVGEERDTYVDVEEGKHDELGVCVVAQAFALETDGLPGVGDHVPVSEGDPLGQAGCTLFIVSLSMTGDFLSKMSTYRAVHQIADVVLRIKSRPSGCQPSLIRRDLRPMPMHPRLIPLIAHQPHHLLPQPRQLRRPFRILQKHLLRDQRTGPRVLQLPRELFDGVCRVGRGGDAAGPLDAEVDGWVVDVVGGEEGEDVAFAPGVGVDEAGAEAGGEVDKLAVGVGAAGVAVDEEGCVVSELGLQ